MCEPSSPGSWQGKQYIFTRLCELQLRGTRDARGQKTRVTPLGVQVANRMENLSFNEDNKNHIINTHC